MEEKNWDGVFQSLKEDSVPPDSNVISSHVVYKIKINEDGTIKLKDRICPHANRDKDKDGIRKNSAATQFPVILLMLILSTLANSRDLSSLLAIGSNHARDSRSSSLQAKYLMEAMEVSVRDFGSRRPVADRF